MTDETEKLIKISKRRNSKDRINKNEVIIYARCMVRILIDTMRFQDFPEDSIENGVDRLNRYIDEGSVEQSELLEMYQGGDISMPEYLDLVRIYDGCQPY